LRWFVIFLFTYLFAGFPDYYYKLPIKKQKEEFKRILLPMIEVENNKILIERNQVINIFNQPFFLMNKNNLLILAKLAKKYKIKNIYDKEEFLKKIDIIPPRLILAQGAIENAWGRSYFVKEAIIFLVNGIIVEEVLFQEIEMKMLLIQLEYLNLLKNHLQFI
jgi:Bax protein